MRFFLILVLVLAAPFSLWLYGTGNPVNYLHPQVPEGQLLYVLSKLAGLFAISLLGLQMILVSARVIRKKVGWSNMGHRLLGVSVLVMTITHIGLFTSAASIRSDHLSIGLFTLRFFQGFYDFMVSVGLVSACLMIFSAFAGYWFHRVRTIQFLRNTHVWLVLAMTILALAHSFSIGTETRSLPIMLFYLIIMVATISTILKVFRKRTSRSF